MPLLRHCHLRFAGAFVVCGIALVALSGPVSAQVPDPGTPKPNDQLPPNFKPPRKPVVEIEDEKISEDDYITWNKTRKQLYMDALGAQSIKAEIKGIPAAELIKEGIHIRVARLSLKVHRHKLFDRRAEILRDFSLKTPVQAVRDFANDQIVLEAKALLDGNIRVRMQAVKLLGEIDDVPPVLTKRLPGVASARGLPVLKSIIEADPKDQPEAVKIFAARSIIRILTEGAIPPQDRSRDELAKSIALEIQRKRDPALERLLVRALIETERAEITNANNQKSALPLTVLLQVMHDTSRTYSVRCEAAEALGRVTLPASVNRDLIAYVTSQLVAQLVADYNSGRISRRYAVYRFQNMFFAIRGRARVGCTDGKGPSGLVNTTKHADITTLNTKYITPMISRILGSIQATDAPPNSLDAKLGAELLAWKKPQNMSVKAGEPAIGAAVTPAQPDPMP